MFGVSAATVASVVGAGAAVYGASQSGKSGGSSGSTTSTATNEPWSKMQPYLTGGTQKRTLKPGVKPIYSGVGGEQKMIPTQNSETGEVTYALSSGDGQGQLSNPESDYDITGTPGIADEAARLYGTTGQTQAQKDFNTQQQGLLNQFNNDQSLNQSIWHNGALANSGAYDTNNAAVAYNPSITAAQNVTPQQVNLQGARAAQGPLDPTTAMQSLLSGTPNNPYLSQQASALTAASNQNLMQNIMPGIGNSAQAAGQYGSSRQGIAQGVAAGNAQTGLDSSIANMYSNAYQQAQQNMYGTANNLNAQAGQNAQNNASLDLTGQQFNSNLQLQNNTQAMQNSMNSANVGFQNNTQTMAQAQNNLNNRVTGSNLITGGQNAQNTLSNNLNASYDATRNQPWTDLAQYQNVIQPLAGMGNSSTQTNPYYTNTAANIMGGASAGLGLGNKIAGMFGSSGGSNATTWAGDSYSGTPYNYDTTIPMQAGGGY